MRKMLQLLIIALAIAIIGLAGFTSSSRADAENEECSTRMSEETSRYIREMNIPLKGADSEFYSSREEQVFLLNSKETRKLDAEKTVRNTVAVINHKEAGGKGSFYVIEQEIRPGKVTFFLKKDSKVLQSLSVQLNLSPRSARPTQVGPGVPCKQGDCAAINKAEAAIDAIMAARANQTCTRQTYCVQHCSCFAGALGVAQVIKYVDPTSKNCWSYDAGTQYFSAQLWVKVTASPLLAQAFEVAIKKEARLYTF